MTSTSWAYQRWTTPTSCLPASLGVAVVAGDPAHAQDLTAQSEVASDSAIKVIEAELFVFSDSGLEGYLQGGARPMLV